MYVSKEHFEVLQNSKIDRARHTHFSLTQLARARTRRLSECVVSVNITPWLSWINFENDSQNQLWLITKIKSIYLLYNYARKVTSVYELTDIWNYRNTKARHSSPSSSKFFLLQIAFSYRSYLRSLYHFLNTCTLFFHPSLKLPHFFSSPRSILPWSCFENLRLRRRIENDKSPSKRPTFRS